MMIDWEDGGEEDFDDQWNQRKAASQSKESNASRGSMRGLQLALSEGWLIQRAREMCSFAHDRYRQAAQAEAARLPSDVIARMSSRVGWPSSRSVSHSDRVTDCLDDA